eukprot:m.120822 g.120822  ORF g.120822 m.120822 type:complete len:245 (+) comp9283_c0_seq7:1784-2518(+)
MAGPAASSDSASEEQPWIFRTLPREQVVPFVKYVRRKVWDPAFRTKMYTEGPHACSEQLQAKAQNGGLICALVFSAVYGSCFSSDLLEQTKVLTESQTSTLTVVCLLYLCMVLSALGVGFFTLANVLLPLTHGKNSLHDTVHVVCVTVDVLLVVDFIPVISLAAAIVSALMWGFVCARTDIMIAATTIAGVLSILFLYFWIVLARIAARAAAVFEKAVLIEKYSEASALLTNAFRVSWKEETWD